MTGGHQDVTAGPRLHLADLVHPGRMSAAPRRHPVARLIREPLIHFLLLGAAVFALYRFVGTESGARRADTILVTQGNIDRMVEAFSRT